MEPKIQTYIMEHKQGLFDLLKELVLIQSHSKHKAGVDRVGQRIAGEMAQMGFTCEFSNQENLGNHLIARSPGYTTEKKQILITGHMDTVFPQDSAFNWYKEDDTRCFGPGVADMKGGLVVGIFAPEIGISANVGTIQGGIGPNTVPDLARAALDFRFFSDADGKYAREQLSGIIAKQAIPGTLAEMKVVSSRPAMPQTWANQELFKQIQVLANELETPVIEELRQGVSDANIIASRGIPVIDGLGPVGAKDHSEDEFINRSSLWERSILFANILAEI